MRARRLLGWGQGGSADPAGEESGGAVCEVKRELQH